MIVAVLVQCKLEQQACLTGKELTLKCAGLCPCPTATIASKESKRGKIDGTATNNRRERDGGGGFVKRESQQWNEVFLFTYSSKPGENKAYKAPFFFYLHLFIY